VVVITMTTYTVTGGTGGKINVVIDEDGEVVSAAGVLSDGQKWGGEIQPGQLKIEEETNIATKGDAVPHEVAVRFEEALMYINEALRLYHLAHDPPRSRQDAAQENTFYLNAVKAVKNVVSDRIYTKLVSQATTPV
jgi:hypothetical protein